MRWLVKFGVLILAALGGAIAFWLPGMLMRGISGSPVPGFLLLSFLGPLAVRGVATRLAGACLGRPGGPWIAEAMLAGIWLLGPIFMMGAVAMSGQLSVGRALGELRDLYSFAPLVPLVTLIFAGSDGSLVGLLASSCMLAYISAELRPEGGPAVRPDAAVLRWMRSGTGEGGRCPVCANDLEPGQTVHRCPLCETAQHLDCHVYLGACARFGCPESRNLGHRACSRLDGLPA